MFSPYYAMARRGGKANPLDHCSINVALYGPRGKSWAMTERPRSRVRRFPRELTIGSSNVSWDGNRLEIDIDEMTAPIPGRIKGVVRLHPTSISNEQIALDRDDCHHWWPIAPCSHVEVDLAQPAVRWSGAGYLDCNMGKAPLEQAFSHWSWSRAKIGRDTAVLYDVAPRQGEPLSLAVRFDSAGRVETFDAPPRCDLKKTGWRLRRETRADPGHDPRVVRTFEDGPFYARSLLSTHLLGEPMAAIHESLSLDRFKSPVVQAMLPFRMPRWPL